MRRLPRRLFSLTVVGLLVPQTASCQTEKLGIVHIKMWVMLALLCSFAGCSLRSNKAGDAETVFAATEVGTPEGAKVTKDIGPAGGTLSS